MRRSRRSSPPASCIRKINEPAVRRDVRELRFRAARIHFRLDRRLIPSWPGLIRPSTPTLSFRTESAAAEGRQIVSWYGAAARRSSAPSGFGFVAVRLGGRDLANLARAETKVIYRNLETVLHLGVVIDEVAHETAVFERNSVRVLEIYRLGPVVIDDLGHFHAFRGQLLALGFESRFGTGLEREVIEGRRNAEAAVDARVIFHRNARYAARLHESQKLITAGIEKDMADLAAFLDFNRVGYDDFETEDPFVKVARFVQIERRKTYV